MRLRYQCHRTFSGIETTYEQQVKSFEPVLEPRGGIGRLRACFRRQNAWFCPEIKLTSTVPQVLNLTRLLMFLLTVAAGDHGSMLSSYLLTDPST
jgi:hypothetical protein